MQLDDMRLFTATLDARSFTAAAERLGLSKQFVSRRILQLEDELGVRLLNRTTRRLQPTELGMTFYERALKILDEVDQTRELVTRQSSEPRGTLRISAPMTFATLHLSPALPGFMRRYPQIALQLDLNDRAVDLLEEGYDMAIRGGVLADSTLIAKRLATLQVVACASPDYLKVHPAPSTPEALSDHACLLYGHGKAVEWRFQRQGTPVTIPLRGQLRVNNGELVRDAAIAGLGIAYLPTFIVGPALAAGTLISLLDEFRPAPAAIYAVYPQHRQSSRPMQLFIDYLCEQFATL